MDTTTQLPKILQRRRRNNTTNSKFAEVTRSFDRPVARKQGSIEIRTRLNNKLEYNPIYKRPHKLSVLTKMVKPEKYVAALTPIDESKPDATKRLTNKKELLSPVKQNAIRTRVNFPSIRPNPRNALYGFVIGGGNNSKLVRRVIELRESFTDIEAAANNRENSAKNTAAQRAKANFYWDSFRQRTKLVKLKKEVDTRSTRNVVYNHFEFNHEVTQKYYLHKNMLARYGDKAHKFLPLTFTLNFESSRFLEQIAGFLVQFSRIYLRDNYTEPAMLEPEDSALIVDKFSKKQLDKLRSRDLHSKTRGFEKAVLNIENLLFSTIYKDTEHKRKAKYSLYNHYLSKSNEQTTDIVPAYDADQNMWLIKPDDLNRGNGVEVFSTIEQVYEKLKKYIEGVPINAYGLGSTTINAEELDTSKVTTFKPHKFVIQKYMERPLLINQRKFDIRIHSFIDQNNVMYLSREGYIRTSSEAFTLNENSHFVHLTNNAVQKHNDNYCKFEEGNILPLSSLKVR